MIESGHRVYQTEFCVFSVLAEPYSVHTAYKTFSALTTICYVCPLGRLHYSGRHELTFTPGEISLRGAFHPYHATEKI